MSELTNYNAAIYVRLSKEDEDASDGRKTKATALPIRNSSFSIIYRINPK